MLPITRFPPSPTGLLHIGSARTALFNWLYARKYHGKMVLRIEDTDRERSTQQSINVILESMNWLGLSWDTGPIYQTNRFDKYADIINQLLKQGDAYYCFCSKERLGKVRNDQRERGEKPKYDRYCRSLHRLPKEGESAVVRFKSPLTSQVMFHDVVRGTVVTNNNELDDLILAREDGSPTYNLTVVVDDIDMNITHVIRGDDHMSNTPRQINIFQALKAPIPVFVHLPLILGQNGQCLSKRYGAVSILEYRDTGILPEAMLNYLIRLGWSHGDQEFFSLSEMIELFNIEDINKSPARFDIKKLMWINQHYIKEADKGKITRELANRLHRRGVNVNSGPEIDEVVQLLQMRVKSLENLADCSEYFYQDFERYDEESAKKHLRPISGDILIALRKKFLKILCWEKDSINHAINAVITERNIRFKELAQPLRVAISGSVVTPSIEMTVKLLGKVRTLQRIEKAIHFIHRSSV